MEEEDFEQVFLAGWGSAEVGGTHWDCAEEALGWCSDEGVGHFGDCWGCEEAWGGGH